MHKTYAIGQAHSQLKFSYWESSGGYVFNGTPWAIYSKRRSLKEGDIIIVSRDNKYIAKLGAISSKPIKDPVYISHRPYTKVSQATSSDGAEELQAAVQERPARFRMERGHVNMDESFLHANKGKATKGDLHAQTPAANQEGESTDLSNTERLNVEQSSASSVHMHDADDMSLDDPAVGGARKRKTLSSTLTSLPKVQAAPNKNVSCRCRKLPYSWKRVVVSMFPMPTLQQLTQIQWETCMHRLQLQLKRMYSKQLNSEF
ncbi:hypothetical protein L7F22_065288 [Adiantum nelumboides]|nr:hypothetical protein [Adiantum nelumboides]